MVDTDYLSCEDLKDTTKFTSKDDKTNKLFTHFEEARAGGEEIVTTQFVEEDNASLKTYNDGEFLKQHTFADDHAKFTEIAELRTELMKAKTAAENERMQREKYAEQLKDFEHKLNNICQSGYEARKSSVEDDTSSLKREIRDLRDESEELRTTLNEKLEQLQEYRVKYIQAQQQVEELKRQIDVIEFDNKQVTDQIHIEIQKMKMQFQEKLHELAPLPDVLKATQIQLQESQQLQKLSEENAKQISLELQRVKEKLLATVNSFNQEKSENKVVMEENKQLKMCIESLQKDCEKLTKELDDYKCKLARTEEKIYEKDQKIQDTLLENSKLSKDLEEMKVESMRSLNRQKERSDTTRRTLQTQISELERQLIQSRAQCRACQKERDEIRQRMQFQINSLQENFELAEMRLKSLKQQLGTLKSNYTLILSEDEGLEEITSTERSPYQ